MKYFIVLLFSLFLAASTISAADKFTDDDLGRIVCRPSYSGKSLQFLVVDKINLSGTVQCHIYGTRQSVTAQISELTATKFYENSPVFLISQYALIGHVSNQKPNLAMELAKLNSSASRRITRFAEFENSCQQMQEQLKNALTANASSPYDQIDAYCELLDGSKLPDMVKSAAAAQDWTLAIIMYDSMASMLQKSVAGTLRSNPDLASYASDMLRDSLQELLTEFGNQIQQDNARRKLFRKHYPQARGLWTESPPRDYRNLRRFCMQSLSSYLRLEQLSRLIEPQDWGSAVLDVLLLTEGIPEAADLEKEFDDQMRRLTKTSASTMEN